MTGVSKEVLDSLLSAASRAPSGDNVQPWRVAYDSQSQCLDLYNDPAKDPSYFNYKQLASYVAHGAFLENLQIAAQTVGLQLKVGLFPEGEESDWVARIGFESSEPMVHPLFESINARCTNRTMYKSGPFGENELGMLRQCQTDDKCGLYLATGDKKNRLAAALQANDRLVFEHKEIHDFLFTKVRWSEAEATQKGDGMPVGTLGVSPPEKAMLPLMAKWGFVKYANLLGLSRFIGVKGRLGCRSASVIGVITIPSNSRADFLEAGQLMQRVWLEGTRLGLAFQPVTGITFLMQRHADQRLDGFSESQRALVCDAENKVREILSVPSNEVLAVGFRMGYARAPKVRTPRQTLRLD